MQRSPLAPEPIENEDVEKNPDQHHQRSLVAIEFPGGELVGKADQPLEGLTRTILLGAPRLHNFGTMGFRSLRGGFSMNDESC